MTSAIFKFSLKCSLSAAVVKDSKEIFVMRTEFCGTYRYLCGISCSGNVGSVCECVTLGELRHLSECSKCETAYS